MSNYPEKWAIVAPSDKKAKIIMGYIIDHTFDNEYTKRKLEVDGTESMDHLRRERSKNRLTFKHSDGTIGEVYVLSADSRNKQKAGESLMGFGAANLILDEASLIEDDIEAKIFRMLGDKMDNFYLKIGNPFYRNHFLDSYRDPKYFKMNIDWHTGILEGRLNQDFIEEAMKKPFFSVLYENKFPEADSVDNQGWSYLLTDQEYERALHKEENSFGMAYMGHDVARGGGNFNVWVKRTENYATILAKNTDNDLMGTAGRTVLLAKEHEIEWPAVSIDDTGLGGGVSDRLREQGYRINACKLGEQARDPSRFINRRAENYWKLKEWLNKGGKLDPAHDWSELMEIKYKPDSAGKIKIMSKDEMRTRGIESPDVADALMLSFDSVYNNLVKRKVENFNIKKKSNKPSYSTRMA